MSFRFNIFGNTIPEEGFQWGAPGYYIDGYGIPRWQGAHQNALFRQVFRPREDYFVDPVNARPIEEAGTSISLGSAQIGGTYGSGSGVPQLVFSQRPLSTAPQSPLVTGATEMSIDLGSIINTVGQAYIANRLAQTPVQTNNPLIPDWMEFGLSGAPVQGPVQQVPTMPAGACSTRGMIFDPAANGGAGKWIRRRSRRRRKIITNSDINQIAALKAIVGNGQALTAAVIKATR